ncbi:MAG: DUF2238 domain-containing protein, partial [Xanthomonadales bacterium]|nr:DUF2238 domain-containing protein [Xanthomonadales bacterium]
MSQRRLLSPGALAWLLVFAVVFGWSAIEPHDRLTWWLEVSPALIALVVLAATRRRFPLTPLLYVLILLHCLILIVGGHYTYARVPLGEWMRETFDFTRNNYDKIGHFAQGFVPAMVARELLVRLDVVRGRGWLALLVVCVALAVSACY